MLPAPAFSSLTCNLRHAMPHKRSLTHSHLTYGTPCHARGHSHTHTKCFPLQLPTPAFNVIPHPSVSYRQVFRPILYFQPSLSQGDSRLCPNPYLGKQRISLGVTIILSICLCQHTQFDYNQFTVTPGLVYQNFKHFACGEDFNEKT